MYKKNKSKKVPVYKQNLKPLYGINSSQKDSIIALLQRSKTEEKNKETLYMYNGVPVARVTTILEETASNAGLVIWANRLGFKHISSTAASKMFTDIGSEVHDYAECVVNGYETRLHSHTPEAANCKAAFDKWWDDLNKQHEKVRVLKTECPMSCKWFGGTCDLIINIDGKNILVDYKTSKDIYNQYFLQLAAYKYLIEECTFGSTMKLDGCMIVRLPKDGKPYETKMLDFSNPVHRKIINDAESTFWSMVLTYYSRSNVYSELNRVRKGCHNNT